MGRAVDEAADEGIPQISSKAPRGEADVDLIRSGKKHVRNRQPWSTSALLLRLRHGAAEIG